MSSRKSESPGSRLWRSFRHHRPALFGLVVISLALIVSVLGANIRPDSSPDANSQNLSIAKKGLNFRVEVLEYRKNSSEESKPWYRRMFFGGSEEAHELIPLHSYRISGDSLMGNKYGGSRDISGPPFQYHLIDVLYPLGSDSIVSRNETYLFTLIDGREMEVSVAEANRMVEDRLYLKTYLLGTDKFGRDMASRLMAGTIISLSVGFISVLISLVLGVSLGAMAGFFGGRIDDFIMWLINVVWSIPTLLLVIAITFALGKGFVQVFIAVGLTMWVEVARVVRGQVLSVKNLEYVEAARVLGYSNFRIIYRHILPNVFGPVIVISAANFASAILLEAGLSFLGIGAQIPMASWGRMIKDHYPYITTDLAYLAILPGLCIVVLVLAFMLVGNGLRESLDKRGA